MSRNERPARIGFLLSQLGALASDLWAAEIRELGITPSEGAVLRIIARSPGITQRALAERHGTTQSRVVAIVDRLEEAGLATRARSTTDRRKQQLELTQQGAETMLLLRQAAERQESAITEGLADEQAAVLAEILGSLTRLRGLDVDLRVSPGVAPGVAPEAAPRVAPGAAPRVAPEAAPPVSPEAAAPDRPSA
jgi:DNA-binding MarR family transcriptional regulator